MTVDKMLEHAKKEVDIYKRLAKEFKDKHGEKYTPYEEDIEYNKCVVKLLKLMKLNQIDFKEV